jgi:1-acyl-sn-glycerol-3-phosphate acyltransferase
MADDSRAIETRGPFAAVRRTFRLVGIALWTPITVGWEALRAITWRGDRRIIIDRAKHAWAIGARWLFNLDMHFVRGNALPPRHATRARLVVSNHRTPLDIVSLMWLFDGHFLANHKTRTAPVVGIAAIRMGTIFVDRDDRRSGAQAIRAMRRALEDKQSIIIFPEGTTYAGDEVRPFKGGAFLAAKGVADVDVVPVGLVYGDGTEYFGESLGQHAKRFLSRKRNPVWIAIGDPEPFPTQKEGTDEVIRARVQAMVDEARRGANARLLPP